MNSYMTPRLAGIASLVRPGASVIDIGSDHAYVPIFLLSEGKAQRALSTDVHDGPLLRSRENIRQAGLEDKICLQKTDGLVGVNTGGYDTIIIAGMGGILIAEILEKADSLSDKRLILQPMTAARELRLYLLQHGFIIERERIIREEEKLYVLLEAALGQEEMYTEAELLIGRKSKDEPLYPLLKAQTEAKLKKRLFGLLAAKLRREEEIMVIENVLKEMSE